MTKLILIFLFFLSIQIQDAVAQSTDSSNEKGLFKTLSKRFSKVFSDTSLSFNEMPAHDSTSQFKLDSIEKQKLKQALASPHINKLSFPKFPVKKDFSFHSSRPFLKFGSGFINYSWNYRAGVDTPFIENNISQHLITSNFNVTISNSIPLNVSYFERESNSQIFRNFRDVRIQLDTRALQRIQADKLRNQLTGFEDKIRDPVVKPAMDGSLDKITQFKSWLHSPSIQKKLIDSKELMISPDILDTSLCTEKKDSILHDAKTFIALYEKVQHQQQKYEKLYDSLYTVYVKTEKAVRLLKQLSNGNLNNPDNVRQLKQMAENYGIHDKRFNRITNYMSSIKTLAVGRTNPNFSNLTLKNTNVNGIDFEFNENNIYGAIVAGTIAYREKDLVYSGISKAPQYVYSARIGYGVKEKNNIILTYFEGRKQLYSGVTANNTQNIKGISVATQFLVSKNTKLKAEFAQSAAPAFFNTATTNKKSNFDFNDKNNQAYSLEIKSYVAATRTRLEGQYQHSGINFQNFTNYRVYSSANSWNLKAEQYFWKRNLHFVAALRKNDFSNPLILQRYDASTIFKNFTITYQKRYWPVISLGYIPSSQYTLINNIVYENRYQILNGTISHSYKLGTARSTTSFMINRFYNNSQDTGFIYYNADNFYLNQLIQFPLYSTHMGVSHTENGNYTLNVLDAGLDLKILKRHSLGMGVKINHINNETNSKVGLYANTKVLIPRLGELNMWLEKSYLANLQHQLTENSFYNISFTRYFN